MTTLTRDQASTALERYLDFWRDMRVEDVPTIKGLVTPDFYFVDPFNEVTSADDMVTLLDHMFEVCDDPRFIMKQYGVSDQSPDDKGHWHGYALWDFSFTPKRGNTINIEGMTALTMTADGVMAAHIDHWDTGQQVLRKIPVLGGMVNAIFGKMAAAKRLRRP
ncbi:MAG: nuclear transport factor 2 family protein [Pseudomonadota bacterium]